jgi:hypothetical protein
MLRALPLVLLAAPALATPPPPVAAVLAASEFAAIDGQIDRLVNEPMRFHEPEDVVAAGEGGDKYGQVLRYVGDPPDVTRPGRRSQGVE